MNTVFTNYNHFLLKKCNRYNVFCVFKNDISKHYCTQIIGVNYN